MSLEEMWEHAAHPRTLGATGPVIVTENAWGPSLSLTRKGPSVGSCLVADDSWEAEDLFCQRPCGAGTWHAGAGKCSKHGGNSRYGSLEGWLIMVHKFAEFQRVTPWEALLEEVERTAAGLRFLDAKVGEAAADEDLLPEGDLGPWVAMRERLQSHGLRVFKATMDVGIDRILAEQNRIDGERMAQVLLAGIEAGNLTEEQRTAVTGAMRRALEAQRSQDDVRGQIEGLGTETRRGRV